MKKGNKITLIILCSILALCVVSIAGALVWRNTASDAPVSEEVVVVENGKASAANETALRELLLKEEEIEITLTEEVTVDKTLIVNGKKTLSGTGSVKMALYVMPYEYLLTVAENASLTLDGVSVNGNGIANGVKVEKNAELTLLSGEVAWGNPYGIEVQGKAEIKGGTITDAIHTGVFVGTSGHVEMKAGTIKSAGYTSTRISTGGYFCLAEDAILQNCGVYHIHNAGTCDVKGGVVRDSKYSLAATEGALNIQYQGTDGGMIEWYNAQGSGIWVGESGTLNANGFYVHDVGYAGVNSGQGTGSIKLTDCKFENTGNNALIMKMAEVELKNIEVIKPGKHGVFVNAPTAVATIENLTVTEPVERGLHNAGGKVTAKNVTVTNSGTYGVSTGNNGDSAGSVVVENLVVTGAQGPSAVNAYKSSLTITKATITDSAKVGARATDGGTLKLTDVTITKTGYEGVYTTSEGQATLKNITVTKAGKHGVYVSVTNSKADIDTLTVIEPKERGVHNVGGTITAKNVTVKNSGLYGVSTGNYENKNTGVKSTGSVTIENLTVTGAQGASAVNAYKSSLTITKATITDSAKVGARVTDGGTLKLTDVEITNTGYEGVYATSEGQATLKNITVTKAGKHGVYVSVTNSKADIDTLTVIEPKERGVHNAGGTITAKNVTVKNSGLYGVSTGNYENKETGVKSTGSVTIENLTVTGAQGASAVNAYKSSLTITKATITDSAKVGARVTDGGTLNLTDVDILNTTNHGVLVGANSTGYLKGLTIITEDDYEYTLDPDVDYGDIRVDAGGYAQVTDATIKGSKEYGLYSTGIDAVMDVSGLIVEKVSESSAKMSTAKDGIRALSKGTVNLSGINRISDTGRHGINVYQTDAKVNINVQESATVETDCLTIERTTERGICNEGGTVVAKNVKVESSGNYAVSTAMNLSAGSVTIDNLTVVNASASDKYNNPALNAYNSSVMTINGGTITNSNGIGARSDKNATLNLVDVIIDKTGSSGICVQSAGILNMSGNSSIANTKSHGIHIKDASVANINTTWDENSQKYVQLKAEENELIITDAGERSVYNVGSTLHAGNVTVNSSGQYAISLGSKATGTITNLTVNGTDSSAGVMSHNSTLTIDGTSTIANTKSNGAVAAGGGSLTMQGNVNINNAGANGVQIEMNSSATLKNVTITNAKKHGIYNEGGILTGDIVKVITPEIYGVYTVKKDDVAGNTNITNLTVTGAKIKVEEAADGDAAVYTDGSTLTLTGASVAASAKSAISVINGGTMTATDVTVTSPESYGLEVRSKANATMQNLTVTGAKGTAAVYSNASIVTVNGGTLSNSTGHGALINYGGTMTLTGVTIDKTESGKNAINLDGNSGASKAYLTDLTVRDAGKYGVLAYGKDGYIEINGLEVAIDQNKETKATYSSLRGLCNNGAKIVASKVNIDSAKDQGISSWPYTKDGTVVSKGEMTINGLVVTNSQTTSAHVNNSTVTVNGMTLTNFVTNGVEVKSGGILNLTDASIEGIGTYGAYATGTNSTLNINGVSSIEDVKSAGVYVEKEAIANINVKWDETSQKYINLDKATNNLTITNSKGHGVYVAVTAMANINALTVTDCTERGLYVVGGTATGNNVTTNSTGKYGISAGASGTTRATITITGLTINGTDANSGIMAHNSDVTINGGTITGTKTDGVTAASGGVATLTDISIINAGRDGVRVEKNSTANLKRVTFSNCAAKETYKTDKSATINILE